MGGGPSGRYIRKTELDELEREAKDRLIRASQPKRRNVFISFAQEDLMRINALRAQAKTEASTLDFIDRSLDKPFNSKDAEYIKRGLRDRIKQASVTLCFVSEDTAKSDWVKWEVEESLKMGKGVIAMYQGDKPPKNTPEFLKEHGIKMVPWNHQVLAKEIDKSAENR